MPTLLPPITNCLDNESSSNNQRLNQDVSAHLNPIVPEGSHVTMGNRVGTGSSDEIRMMVEMQVSIAEKLHEGIKHLIED